MKVNMILRKVCLVVTCVGCCDMTLQFIMGEMNNLISVIAFCLTWLGFIMNVIQWIRPYKDYKIYKEGYDYLKAVHKARYKLYFSGNNEEIDIYSREIERYGTILIRSCERHLVNQDMSKKMCNKIRTIIDETKKLMNTTQSI